MHRRVGDAEAVHEGARRLVVKLLAKIRLDRARDGAEHACIIGLAKPARDYTHSFSCQGDVGVCNRARVVPRGNITVP